MRPRGGSSTRGYIGAICRTLLLCGIFACAGSGNSAGQKQDASPLPDRGPNQAFDGPAQGDHAGGLFDAIDAIDAPPPSIASQPDASIGAETWPVDLLSVADSVSSASDSPESTLDAQSRPSDDATASTDSPAGDDHPIDDMPTGWDSSTRDEPAPAMDSMPIDVVEAVCTPETGDAFCVRTGNQCGSVDGIDSCGQPRSANCGACLPGLSCSAAHQCVCAPETADSLCTRNDKHCGSYMGSDNCGQGRTVTCGTCGAGSQCNGQNQCVCTPESDATFCVRSGKACGAFSGTDNCGQPRTVPDCGSCNDANACTNDLCNAGTCRHVSLLACGLECSPAINCNPVDTDGDGLNDVWEQNGYVDLNCNGQYDEGIDTPLPDADKNKPNVYVKWDYMRKSAAPAHSHMPSAEDMDWARRILANHNIVLRYYPTNDEIAEIPVVSVSPPGELLSACAGSNAVSFTTLKAAHFPPFLAPAYHYALFGHSHTCSVHTDCSSCPANEHTVEAAKPDSTGVAVMPGRDLIVSFGYWNDIGAPVTGMWITGSFLHQLGHNMGLGNGGGDNLDGKPNYISVMNSSYATGIPLMFPWNPAAPWTYLPNNSAGGYDLDFSTFTAATLHEGRDAGGGLCGDDGSGGLDETVGVPVPDGFQTAGGHTNIAVQFTGADLGPWLGPAGHPIDWDTSGPTEGPADNRHVFGDVSGDGMCNDLPGFNDMETVSAGPGVTKMAHLQPNAACTAGRWTNGISPTP